MKLPDYEQAIISERKMVNYLLDETHPTGKHKAIFFQHFGFSLQEWLRLANALREHAASYDVSSTLNTPEGAHYVIEGELISPDDRNPSVRSVWAIDFGSLVPRFITAYPLEK
jgi:hypothetical protein